MRKMRSDKRVGAKPGPAPSDFISEMADPVDPEVFLMMVHVYQSAAGMSMPTRNPREVAKFEVGAKGETFSLADTPQNRGMLEVMRQLRELGIKNPQAYTARIMSLPAVLRAVEGMPKLMRRSAEPGTTEINSVVFEAVATGRYSVERMGFDVDDVVARALALAAEGTEE